MIRTTVAIAILSLLAACTPTVIDTSCQAFGPITFDDRSDTATTVAQVRRHNAAWDRLCK